MVDSKKKVNGNAQSNPLVVNGKPTNPIYEKSEDQKVDVELVDSSSNCDKKSGENKDYIVIPIVNDDEDAGYTAELSQEEF